jgi:hypothetical protein
MAAALAEDHESIVDVDIQFHELVIVKSGWPHCEQIWRCVCRKFHPCG